MGAAMERVRSVLDVGDDGMARCPAHADGRPSLHVTQGDKGVVLKCFAGCDTPDIASKLGLGVAELFDEPRKSNGGVKRQLVASYPYVDERGELLFEVVRYEPKDFRQRRPEGNGWAYNLNGTRRVLYRLPELIAAVGAGVPVWVVEGEKDVHALEAVGEVATTCPMGAGKWRSEYTETLRGAHVILVVDDDEPGRAHAKAVALALESAAASLELRLPAKGHKDVAEHLGAGRALGDLRPFTLDESADESWGQPMALEVAATPFPLSSLPAVLGNAASTVAGMLSTPLDLPAAIALACVAAAARGRVDVACGPDWVVPTNLYAIAVAAPGESKSPALTALVRPLREAEQRLAQETESDRRRQKVDHDAAQFTADRARDELKKHPEDAEAQRLLEDALASLDRCPEAVAPRLLIGHDATPEVIVTLLAQQGGALSIVTDEGAELFAMMGRYQSKGANTGVFLAGFDGGRYTRDRQQTAATPTVVERALLTVFAAIQPGTLDTIRGDKNREQGLLGRFAYFYPTSRVGSRPTDAPPLDHDAMERYSSMLNRVVDTGPRHLRLTPMARAEFDRWRTNHEPRLGATGDLHAITDWASKLPGLVLRLVGILHLAHEEPNDVIEVDTVADGIAIADYLVSHALRSFDQMNVAEELANARKLLAAIARNVRPGEAVSARDAYRWARIAADDAAKALIVLEDFGWARLIPVDEPRGAGRPPADRYEIHPLLFANPHRSMTNA